MEGGTQMAGDGAGSLKRAYHKVMLMYHPDRMTNKSIKERVLAEEITKHVTSVWQSAQQT